MLIDLLSKGGIMMIPLLLCSVVSSAVIADRLLFWFLFHRRKSSDDINTILTDISKNKLDSATAVAVNSTDLIAGILKYPLVAKSAAIQSELDRGLGYAFRQKKRHMPILETIITIAPLLGILGTVVGIILSFDLLGNAGIQDPKAVMGGISQALITTAFGLGIAVMTVVPYNYFLSKIDKVTIEIEDVLSRFEGFHDQLKASKK